ncbi:MAG: alpha-amylase family glycosyl hydrolase [Bacteroidetes bacterium]|nr:alpha-amylase family glycosyl hydrolase [Bacteroidota bacterium]
MHVIGDFNNWTFGTTPLKRHALHADSVHWWVELTGLTSGEQIGYQYVSEGTGAETDLRFADMFSTLILDATNDPHIPASIYPNIKSYPTGMTTGPVSILQTNQTAYNWTVTDFERPDHEELVIYELLMRDFLAEHDWEALTDTLSYLEKLGINAIELMPIAEFNGNLSWGYNPTFYFAPDKYYGPAEDLKEFIDEAHKRGIAVILDVVYNHVDQPSPLVTLYDAADNPWINTPAPHGVLSFFYDLNHENTYTRYWLDRVNKYWMTEFNVDGFRFDLTKGMTQTVTTDDAGWSNYDQSRINILKRMADSLWAVDDEAYIILEHWTADQEERELGTYRTSEGKPGMMVWGNVTHPFQEALMGYHDSAGKSNFSNVYYGMGGRGWPVPNVVTFMESHDEQWQMYQMRSYGNSSGSYDVKTLPVALNRLKMAGTFAFLIPEPRMIWQFGELGYGYGDMGEQCLKEPASCLADGPGRVDAKPIRWDYNAGTRRLLYETWASLLKIRKENEIFRSRVTEVYMSGMNDAAKRIFLRHAATNMEEVIVGNFGVTAVNNIAALPTTPSIWYDYFSGESVTPSSLPSQLQPGEFHLYTSQKLTPPDQVLIPDNEGNTAGIDIAEEEVTVEEGSSVQVAVKLTSKPSNDVTINITGQISKIAVDTDSSTPNINESTLTFTPTNWGTAKMVTVTGEQDDDIQDETMTVTFTSVSADLNYNSLTQDLTVMVQDDDQSGILVSSDLDPFIIDEGGSSSYKVRLRSIPSSNVTVTISGQGNLLTVDTDPSTPNMNESAITFTTTDWNVEKTVIVSGEEDADALDATVTLTHTATSSDLSYNAITEEFSVGIKDDEAGKIVVNTDSDPLEVNEGEAKAYTVQLSSLPSSEVTVTITGQGSEVAIDTDGNTDGDQSTLVFGISTWNSTQSVTVTGSEDSDGNNESLTLTHTAASTDQNFNDTKEDVIVTVVDDDAVGIELTPSSIAVTEEASNSYQVELSTEPSENVMVTITGVETGITLDNDNNPETPFTSLIFLTGSWNVAQTVTVSVANDDNADNELITLTHTATSQDTQYNNLTKELEVNVTDNDAAGLSAPQTLSVNEGETSEFAVSLSSVPTADVTVQITGSQGSDLTITPSSLTFTAQSWSTGQDVSVVAGQDNDLLDDEVVITLAASGGGFVNVTHQITVTVDDDDTAGVVILPATNPFTLAEGGNTSYTIQLRSAPSADVEVTLSGQGRKLIVDMDPSTPNTNESRITFTGVSWGSARTINIISEEDDDAQDERITLIHTTSSSYETYNALTQQLIVQVIDDEEIGIFVRSNPDPLEVNEGEDQTYSVQLGSAPSENVVITITGQRGQLSVDTDAVESGAQSILIFTSASWNIAQQVTIIGPQDDDASNETLTLTHTSTSGDASYNNLTQALAVVITDDDEEDIVVSPISVAVTEELTTSYEVALASEPLADVTVQISGQGTTLSLDDDNDPNTEFSSLVYTSNNWNQPQPITVTALSDNNTDDEVILLTHTATSPDAGYNNLVKELEINVTDKDAIGLSAPLTLSVNEGASGQFSVSLSSEPTSQVMVDISGYQGTDLTVDPSILVFDVENWSQQQRVNVEADEDSDTQNDEFDLTLIANGGGLINVIHELSVIVVDDDEGRSSSLMLLIHCRSLKVKRGRIR